jgi:hypothetical protein
MRLRTGPAQQPHSLPTDHGDRHDTSGQSGTSRARLVPMAGRIKVYLEVAPKRSFAVAVDWPGWSRSGRDEAEALANLAAYGGRYADVVGRSIGFRRPKDVGELEVVERMRGGSGTEFGVPGAEPKVDDRPIPASELTRQRRLLRAAWRAFDRAAEAAAGVKLRTGPRGGGRDLVKMTGHVFEAEVAYLGKLGSRFRHDAGADPQAEMTQLRAVAIKALDARVTGKPLPDPRATHTLWSPRYYVRRAAWHVLDHAWELEDRMNPEP